LIEEPIAKNEKPGATIGQPLPAFSISLPPLRAEARKYIISDCRRIYKAGNTLFLAVEEITTPEIHYFWPSQILQRWKYIISGCRRIYNAGNTLFLAVADLQGPEIHYF